MSLSNLYSTLYSLRDNNGDKMITLTYQDFLNKFEGNPEYAQRIYDTVTGNTPYFDKALYSGTFSEFIQKYNPSTYRDAEYIRRKNLTDDQFLSEFDEGGEELFEDVYGDLDAPGWWDSTKQWVTVQYEDTKKKRYKDIAEARNAYTEAMNPNRKWEEQLDDKDTVEKYIQNKHSKKYYGEGTHKESLNT